MGSPVQVNRLIQKEQEEERRIQADIEKKKIEEAQRLKELELKAIRRAKKEKKRQLEEERKQREQQDNGLQSIMTGAGSKSLAKHSNVNIQALLRQSLNSNLSGGKADYDQRNHSMINCMRKLFEEARAYGIEELNGESLFKDEAKNYYGQVQKDEFVYAFLNN